MANKLYEANNVQKIATALKNKVKEYYTKTDKTGSEAVDTSSSSDTWMDNYDGMNERGTSPNKSRNVKFFRYKEVTGTDEPESPLDKDSTEKPLWVYDNTYKVNEIGPYIKDDEKTGGAHALADMHKRRFLGIMNLVTRLGFPDSSSINMQMTSGVSRYAPDNGWFVAYNTAYANNSSLQFTNSKTGVIVRGDASPGDSGLWPTSSCAQWTAGSYNYSTHFWYPINIIMPCSRYDYITFNSSNAGTVYTWFVPAKKTNYLKSDGTKDDTKQYKIPDASTGGVNYTSGNAVPSDGFVVYNAGTTATAYGCQLTNNSNNMRASAYNSDSGLQAFCFLPVASGQSVTATINGGGSLKFYSAY